jgi:hypothetical protein
MTLSRFIVLRHGATTAPFAVTKPTPSRGAPVMDFVGDISDHLGNISRTRGKTRAGVAVVVKDMARSANLSRHCFRRHSGQARHQR